jgi:uncharacterized membrane protein
MNRNTLFQPIAAAAAILLILSAAQALAFSLSGRPGATTLEPSDGVLSIPLEGISDGKAHYFKVLADDGVLVTFFTVKSADGVVRAAVDSCDVCYRSGKGYVQEGDFMVCTNCGLKFATSRINEVKGGCNPAPLDRIIDNGNLTVRMADINANSWYCKFKKQ